jgi:hypothetical protein
VSYRLPYKYNRETVNRKRDTIILQYRKRKHGENFTPNGTQIMREGEERRERTGVMIDRQSKGREKDIRRDREGGQKANGVKGFGC